MGLGRLEAKFSSVSIFNFTNFLIKRNFVAFPKNFDMSLIFSVKWNVADFRQLKKQVNFFLTEFCALLTELANCELLNMVFPSNFVLKTRWLGVVAQNRILHGLNFRFQYQRLSLILFNHYLFLNPSIVY